MPKLFEAQALIAKQVPDEIENVMNGFAEVMSRLMIDQHQQQIAALDLTLLQLQALRVLRRGPVPTGKLAGVLRISASAVTQLTDRLVRKELIERQAVAGDRRSVLVALSAKGRRLVDGFRKRRILLFREALTQLKEGEQAHVIKGMKLLIKALESNQQNTAGRATPDTAQQ
jgi:DNA-binding MarR family transcriptional regulator